jgi:hypothetical protein
VYVWREVSESSLSPVGRPLREPLGIDCVRIEVVRDPIFELGMTFVLGMDRVAPGAAHVLGRAASRDLDQARIKNAGYRVDETLDFDRVLPAVAKVVEVSELLGVLEGRGSTKTMSMPGVI